MDYSCIVSPSLIAKRGISSTSTHILLLSVRYEKLQRWDDALKAYTAKAAQASTLNEVLDATLG